MIKKLLPLLLLYGCSSELPHDYAFEKRQYTSNKIEVTLVEHNSYAEIRQAYVDYAKKPAPRSLIAFSEINPKFCIIHTIKPEIDFQPKFVGHEIMHCFYGQWHPSVEAK